MIIPEELKLREQRLSAIAAAKTEIERRAAERFTREQATYSEKVAAGQRSQKRQARSRKANSPSR